MMNVSGLTAIDKEEIASYIRDDTLEEVNRKLTRAVPRDSFYTKYLKRVFDLLIGLFAFIITAPINLIIGIVTFFDVGFPVLFRQKRIGKNQKQFTIYKFRNMTNEKDANGELLPPSQRITKWGSFVRKTSLDELLNFVSVIKGDMSIIGPRPLIEIYVDRLNVRHQGMYLVKPGLECPILNRIDHPMSWQDRLDNNVWYVENCSFLIDLKLCLRVVSLSFNSNATKVRSKAAHGGFMGYDTDGNVLDSKSIPEKYVERFLKEHGFSSLEEALEARAKS